MPSLHNYVTTHNSTTEAVQIMNKIKVHNCINTRIAQAELTVPPCKGEALNRVDRLISLHALKPCNFSYAFLS